MTHQHFSSAVRAEPGFGYTPEHPLGPETVVLRFRRHGSRVIVPILILCAVAAATGYWVGALPETWMNVLAGFGAALVALLFGIGPILSWLARRTTVTTRRVIMRQGVTVRHRAEIQLSRVREVRTRRGLGQRLAGSGTITLLIGAESTDIDSVPGVVGITEALQELVERNYEAAMRSARLDPLQ